MIPITATIITYNEEDRIGETVSSLACCDEVVVVDSGSTDRTRDIAAHLGARVLQRAWEGYARQKNFAAGQASHDWILNVDADERPSAELVAEITRWKATADPQTPLSGASMPRLARYEGRWIRHSGWYPDRKIRLYQRERARWEGEGVHETLHVDGTVLPLSNDLLHFPYRSREDHLNRIDRYTRIAAEDAHRKGIRSNHLKMALAPAATFLKSYVLQAGFLDGHPGLVIAWLGARYVLRREMRILRAWNGSSP